MIAGSHFPTYDFEDKLRLRSWERAPLLAKLVEFVTSNRNILRKLYRYRENVNTVSAHFFERLTKEGISKVGGNYRRVYRDYHKKHGITPTPFKYDVHSMIAGSHFPTYDFADNRDFTVDSPEVIHELMNREIAGTPPRPKYVHAKVARAAEGQEITPFQRSKHTYTYEWWIKNYPGVPYLRHPAMRGVKPSMEEM